MKALPTLDELVGGLLNTLLPEICVLCRARSNGGLCDRCRLSLPRIDTPCPRCALPFDAGHEHCRRLGAIDRLIAPFAFRPPITDCIHALKFSRRRSIARSLALATVAVTGPAMPRPDCWVPVPLHRLRLAERTFNQAHEIAAVLARITGRPVASAAVMRPRATAPQSTLPAAQRAPNIDGAFRVVGQVRGRRIVVVDDVVTTGATLAAVAAALVAAGARTVDGYAVARTVPRSMTPAADVPGR